MCIIAAKPAGVRMPTRERIDLMWKNNPHGAGLMYVKNGAVQVEKGFMTLESFYQRLDQLDHEMDLTAADVVLHFRVASKGDVCPEFCHPFPVSGDDSELKSLCIATDVAMVHNGNIPEFINPLCPDTMNYVKGQMVHLFRMDPHFYKNPHALNLIARATRNSFVVLLAASGDMVTIGSHYFESEGILYSNRSFEESPLGYTIYSKGQKIF